jgi:hypothetical protein
MLHSPWRARNLLTPPSGKEHWTVIDDPCLNTITGAWQSEPVKQNPLILRFAKKVPVRTQSYSRGLESWHSFASASVCCFSQIRGSERGPVQKIVGVFKDTAVIKSRDSRMP